MGNPWAGEVALEINGQRCTLKLTLGALAELESSLKSGSLMQLVERFESGQFSAGDILLLLTAGLRGGGWEGELNDLSQADIAGGPLGAARAAAELLARAFAVPEHEP